ncbi:MAG: autotransporter assembly complex protein TamA [Phenylobacterium sp.]
MAESRLFLAGLAGLTLLGAFPALAAPQLRAQVRGDLPADLRIRIETAVGTTDRPARNRFDSRQRANAAASEAAAVLRSEGYYAFSLQSGVSEDSRAEPFVEVTPGPQFRIQDVSIEWIDPAPDPSIQALGRDQLRLTPGQPVRAIDVVSAEGRVLAAIQKQGYADAFIGPREVIVDHADQTLRPRFRINSGGPVRLGPVRLETDGRTRPAWLAGLSPWKPGAIYDPDAIAGLEKGLVESGAYDQVTVTLTPPEAAMEDGVRPVVVALTDRKPRRLEAGASFSSSDGLGADMRWSHFNQLGMADTSAVFGRASTIDSRLGVQVTLPHWRRLRQSLNGYAAGYRRETSAYDETGLEVRADIQRRRSEVAYVTVGSALEYTQTREKSPSAAVVLRREQVIGSVLGALAFDSTDNVLNPTTGWRVDIRAEPTLIAGSVTLSYVKASIQGSAYLPLGPEQATVLAVRARTGAILGGTLSGVPASRRFYAGGGGSVRGYVFQGIGPHLADDTPVGGLSLVEVSGEVRHRLSDRWGLVAFADAGSVGRYQEPAFDGLNIGAGLGVRYDLGFGPIRFDLAFPLNRRSGDPGYQVYVSIGQSF